MLAAGAPPPPFPTYFPWASYLLQLSKHVLQVLGIVRIKCTSSIYYQISGWFPARFNTWW